MAVSPSPNDLTRQQLDELDTLLQRMLSLPLNQPEPAVAYPPPPPLPDLPAASWRTDTPTPTKTPHLAAEVPPAVVTPSFLPFPPAARAAAPESPPVRLFAPDPFSPKAPASEPPVMRSAPTQPQPPTPAEEYAPPVGSGTLRGVDAPALPRDFRPAPEPPVRPAPPLHPSSAVEFPEVNPFADLPETTPPAPEPAAAPPVPVPLWPLFAVNWVIEFALGWFGPLGHILTRPLTKTLLGWLGVLLLLGAGVWAARGMGWVSWPR